MISANANDSRSYIFAEIKIKFAFNNNKQLELGTIMLVGLLFASKNSYLINMLTLFDDTSRVQHTKHIIFWPFFICHTHLALKW